MTTEKNMEKLVEHSKIFRNASGTEVKISVKAECSIDNAAQETLSFIAQSSRKFYLDVADKINNMP